MVYMLPGPRDNTDKLKDFINKLLDHPKFQKLIMDSVGDKIKIIPQPKRERVTREEFPPEFYNDPIRFIFDNVSRAEQKIMAREINKRYGE